jgi:hypothetical protein
MHPLFFYQRMPYRNNLLRLLLIVLICTSPTLAAVPNNDLSWESVAPGIDYQQFKLPTPNNVFVARMDRSNLYLTLESMIAQGKLSEGRETVSSMFSRYDQALNFWGGSSTPPNWSMRNQAVVAINGSYYDIYSGVPQGGQVQAGWYAKRYDDLGGWSGFAWKLDRSALIGECVYHNLDKQRISFPATGNYQPVNHINDQRRENELVIYTPQYNSQTGTDNTGTEVMVEMTRPTLILPNPSYATGFVRQIRVNQGNSLIPFNFIVLSAKGTAAQTLLANIQVGSEVHVSQEITSYDSDCTTPNGLSWTKTYSSVQGAFFFLKNSQIRDFNDPGALERNPRTAIVYNDQFIYFVVVDGRDTQHSVGMTIHELALFTRDTLGASWGVAQDGGGSSTLVINGEVMNNTYCNNYYCIGGYSVYLPLVTHKSPGGQAISQAGNQIISSEAGVERAVANGMLMVIAQPGEFSTTFLPGNAVVSVTITEVRLGPGVNYASFTTIPAGTNGMILDQTNGLDGVLAKGYFWWYVDFGTAAGWVPEGTITPSGNDGWGLDLSGLLKFNEPFSLQTP